MLKTLPFITGLALLSACSLAPKYERPAPPVPETFPATATALGDTSADTSPPAWETFFNDARLQAILRLALENNRDLRVAGLKVERLRALYDIQRTALIPSLNATADGARKRTPWDLSPSGSASTGSTYQIGLEIPSYELDFFGRVASLRDQVLQQYLATEEARRSAQISLVSAVARQYFLVLATEEQQTLARQTFDAADRAYALNKKSFDAGIRSELDLRTAESQRESLRASLAEADEAHALARNLLTQLVGAPLPAELPLAKALRSQDLIDDLPAGLPSDLLQRRPDILAAEHTLQAANANIGIARAAFFPSVKLTAFGGTASAELSGLFKDGSGAWSFAPSITLPIFTAGRNRAQLKVAKVEKRIEIAHYEQTIQNAFREVADGLATRASVQTRITAQQARVAAAQRRYELSEKRFEAGVDDFLTVLLAQQEWFAAQQQLITARLARLNNLTSLYAALGGGWEGALEKTDSTAQ